MRTVLVTGSDTGVGKTRVVAALARLLSADGASVQIVKVVETGRGVGTVVESDVACARRLSGTDAMAVTLISFAEPLAPPAAARAEDGEISFVELVQKIRALPACDWRILEGAGGIATPLDEAGRDWADFSVAVAADATVVVVPDRLGAINQARLAYARAVQCGLHTGVWLNATSPVDAAVKVANRDGLSAARVPLWAEQAHDALLPMQPEQLRARLIDNTGMSESGEEDQAAVDAGKFPQRCQRFLAEREQQGSTFLNEGIALPHARFDELISPQVALGLTRAGLLDVVRRAGLSVSP